MFSIRSLFSSMQCNHKKYLLCLNIITLILNRNDDDYFSLKSHICFNCEKGRNSSPQSFFFFLYNVALHNADEILMLHKTCSSVSCKKLKLTGRTILNCADMQCLCVYVFCNMWSNRTSLAYKVKFA